MARIPILPLLLAALATSGLTAENAALARFGTTIAITCNHPHPLNDRWAKPADMLRAVKPAGPIINDLASARITIAFPIRLHVSGLAFTCGDYKGGWSRAKEVAVEVDGKPVQTLQLAAEGDQAQAFPISIASDRLELVVRSVYPPRSGAPSPIGGFNQIQVLVDDDLEKTFSAPPGFATDLPQYLMPTANLGARPTVTVLGRPRTASGHPCTIWDAEDIADLKRQIAGLPAAADAYQRCLTGCDKLVSDRLQVPDEPDYAEKPELGQQHTRIAAAIANLGIGYALSGDERYAGAARDLLLQLADRYEGWPVHQNPKMKHDASK